MNHEQIQDVAEIDFSQVSIKWQDLPANTIWHYKSRKVSDCGFESQDGTVIAIVMIDASGDALQAAPNPPQNLTAEAVAGGKVRLNWYYSTLNQAVNCDGFRIYMDSGSGFDFETPTATKTPDLPLTKTIAGGEFDWTSDALTHGQVYKFCVRAFKTGGGETQNTDFVSAKADAQGPAAITGLRASWQEI